jgi:hypothetical protein
MTVDFALDRDFNNDKCTLGVLYAINGDFEVKTLELPWLDNTPNISCIPEGVYECRRSTFHVGGYPCWEICDIEGRTLVKIHIGNYPSDILGCVIVGMGRSESTPAVWSSKTAFTKFMENTKDMNEFQLEIRNV